jgi:hypothetical protein
MKDNQNSKGAPLPGKGSRKSNKELNKSENQASDTSSDKKDKGKTAVIPDETDQEDKPAAKGSNGYGPATGSRASRTPSSYGSGDENASGGGYQN